MVVPDGEMENYNIVSKINLRKIKNTKIDPSRAHTSSKAQQGTFKFTNIFIWLCSKLQTRNPYNIILQINTAILVELKISVKTSKCKSFYELVILYQSANTAEI